MANSIVFQNSAEQLKTSIYGLNSNTNAYQALQINNNGELKVTTGAIGTLNKIDSIGTINKVVDVGTINKVLSVGTVNKVAGVETLGTVNKVTLVGTLNKVVSVGVLGTINKVINIGSLNMVSLVGTLNKVSQIGTLNRVVSIGTLGTLNKVSLLGTLSNIVGTVKVNLVNRKFDTITQTITVISATTTYTNLIDISKYQDTSWYLRNITTTNRAVTVHLAATPSSALGTYPRVLISETATINATPKIITNDYYLKYITAQITNTANIPQRVAMVFNGRL